MSDCDSCSGCPASAEPGTCEKAGKPEHVFMVGGTEYEARPEVFVCQGCVADGDDDLCAELSSLHDCDANDCIFARKTQRLSPADFDQLKAQAIEQHAGAWLHHWGQLVEAEVLSRNGIKVAP